MKRRKHPGLEFRLLVVALVLFWLAVYGAYRWWRI
jgi:hypothetical protein